MARIRSIKPEFWTSEQIMECSPMARLLFIGMWNFCDDAGNHPASSKTLKAEVFPGDDILAADIDGLVSELIAQGLLVEYASNGKRFWHVTGWHHQKIEKPNCKHPPFVADQSPTSRRPVADQSPPEWSGEEGSKPSTPQSVVGNSTEDAREPERPAALLGPVPDVPDPPQTRRGLVCRLLRQAGVSDAAPHHLTNENWEQLLAKRTDEEIVEFAKTKLATRHGQRTGLKYLAPGLLEDPAPITGPPPRASPRMSARDAGRLAAARTIFGTEIEAPQDGNRNAAATVIDITPAAPGALGLKDLRGDAG